MLAGGGDGAGAGWRSTTGGVFAAAGSAGAERVVEGTLAAGGGDGGDGAGRWSAAGGAFVAAGSAAAKIEGMVGGALAAGGDGDGDEGAGDDDVD
jgi:hypothetical protein